MDLVVHTNTSSKLLSSPSTKGASTEMWRPDTFSVSEILSTGISSSSANSSGDGLDTTGTKLPFGVVAIKKKDLEAVKEQAKAYTANRDEIGELRERSAAVSRREQRADQREQHLNNKSDELARQQQQLQQMYF